LIRQARLNSKKGVDEGRKLPGIVFRLVMIIGFITLGIVGVQRLGTFWLFGIISLVIGGLMLAVFLLQVTNIIRIGKCPKCEQPAFLWGARIICPKCDNG
jgi:hypothetical protein